MKFSQVCKKCGLKILFAMMGLLLVLFLFLTFVCYQRATKEYLSIDNVFEDGTIFYNGQYYNQKDNLDTYILMGIDNTGGQADTIFLAVADNDADELYLIPVNRNTMAEIDVYTSSGEYLGKQKRQLCLAHSIVYTFADGNESTKNALSQLLHDVPIDHYIALDMDGISSLGSIIGDVSITFNETLDKNDVRVPLNGASENGYVEGQEITVSADNLNEFLRVRDVTQLGGSQGRLERQTDYLLACYNKMSNLKGKFSILKNLLQTGEGGISTADLKKKYNEIKQYVTTDVDDAVGLAAKYLTYDFSEENIYYVPHLTRFDKNGVYEECHMKDSEMKQILLKVFYQRVLY